MACPEIFNELGEGVKSNNTLKLMFVLISKTQIRDNYIDNRYPKYSIACARVDNLQLFAITVMTP